MPNGIPVLFEGLVDDAAVFPPGNAPLDQAVTVHRAHRTSWYAPLVGPLLVRASEIVALPNGVDFPIGVVGDRGLVSLDAALTGAFAVEAKAPLDVRQVEIAVAKRGEDPLPGLRALTVWAERSRCPVYAEIPHAWGLHAALDHLAECGVATPKFRTGGLASELFPSPEDLAAVIVACAERGLRFKLTAGLHHAVRHTDPATGFTHYGFLNILVAAHEAARGGGTATVAEALRMTDPAPLRQAVRQLAATKRSLWTGFGSCSVREPLADLVALGLIEEGNPA